jgi:H+/Cl- antiporter ClcA
MPDEQNQIPAVTAAQPNTDGADKKETYGNLADVLIAAVVSVVLYGLLVWFAAHYNTGEDQPLLLLCGITGGALGWIAGILASPYDPEKTSFAEFGKLIYGFLSGYVLSKFDPAITKALGLTGDGPLAGRAMVFATFTLASFLIAVAVTYISRMYWKPKPEKRN